MPRISNSTLVTLLPTDTNASPAGWSGLMNRADAAQLDGRAVDFSSRGPVVYLGQGDGFGDPAEGRAMTRANGVRLYPQERALVPLYGGLLEDSGFTEVAIPPGDLSLTIARRDSMPWADVTEPSLREVARRIATTPRGSDDAETTLLRFQDLISDRQMMTPDELVLVDQIGSQYFPPSATPTQFRVPIYANPATGVTIELLRTKSLAADTQPPTIGQKNDALSVTARPGSKVWVRDDYNIDLPVATVGANGTVEIPFDPVRRTRGIWVQVVQDEDGAGIAMPKVTDRIQGFLPREQ